MIKKDIESFLISKQSYLKNSPLIVAKAIWKISPKHSKPKTHKELLKEIEQIREVQKDLRRAKTLESEVAETKLLDIYQEILDLKNKPKKILFFDIETSPNLVLSWRIGREVSLSHDDILKERAIICLAYKWGHEDIIHSLEWSKGNDKDMLEKFSKVIHEADIVIGQNSDRFDIKWLRTRCLYFGIPFPEKLNSLDTLKFAKAGFYFNSNKLDYLGHFLGVGKKIKTEYDLWKSIILENDKEAMNKMVKYCKEDVALLERVYHKLQAYVPTKKFRFTL